MADPKTMTGLVAQLTLRAAMDPSRALDLLSMAWAFRRRDWWRHPPFLPLPDPVYLEWRLNTAYGAEYPVPPVRDVLRFARWRRGLLRD